MLRLRLIIIAILLTVGVLPAVSSGWETQSIELDTGYETDISAPIVIDSNGTLHTVYFADTDDNGWVSLIYAYHTGSNSWVKQTVQNDVLPNNDCSKPSIVLDAYDNPYIFYRDNTGTLHYRYWTGTGWSPPMDIDSANKSLLHCAIIDANGMLNIVYFYYDYEHGSIDNGQLRLARGIDESFDTEIIEPDGNYLSSSITIDTSNRLHLCYYDEHNSTLTYAIRDDGIWTKQVVDNIGDAPTYIYGSTSLAIDASNLPHISYYDFANGDLKYAYFDGNDWQIQIIDSDGIVGKHSSLVLDSQGAANIAYRDESNKKLNYAIQNGSLWQIETVYDDNPCGKYPCLILDPYGRAHISHFDNINHTIYHSAIPAICGDMEYPYPDGDYDENCYVDAIDYALFSDYWLNDNCLNNSSCDNRDLDNSGTVDTTDLSMLLENWLIYSGP